MALNNRRETASVCIIIDRLITHFTANIFFRLFFFPDVVKSLDVFCQKKIEMLEFKKKVSN